MRPELDAALVRDFPNLYRKRNDETSCMARGFECGDGWEPLIRTMSAKIEPYCVNDGANVSQVKQKFGLLRVYMDGARTPAIWTAINEAEAASAETCETCGEAGRMRTTRGWMRAACDACFAKS